jgi:hypothetical protein
MTFKEASDKLGCVLPHVHVLIKRGKLERLTLHEVSDASVEKYVVTRRLKRKTQDDGFISARHVPKDLLQRFRAAVPGGSSFTQCLISAMESWLVKEEKVMNNVLIISDVFEIAGEFSPELRARFDAFDLRVIDAKAEELVRYELELVEDLCTNTGASLTEEHLLRVVVFLNAKLDSLQ